MATKPFASSADLTPKDEVFVELAEGVYTLTAEGDPNVAAIEAEDFLICFEARATPRPPADGSPSCANTPASRSATWCSATTTPSARSAPARSTPRRSSRTR